MAYFEQNLLQWLDDNLGVLPAPCHLPQDVQTPAVVFTITGEDHVHNLLGGSGVAFTTVRFDCLAAVLTDAYSLAETIRLGVDGFSGVMGTTTLLTVEMEQDSFSYEPALSSRDTGTYKVSAVYKFAHREAQTGGLDG